MSLQLISPPAIEPVTLDEAKAHLKVDTTDDDTLITSLIAAARIRAEWLTRRAFITQSWMLWRDRWPCHRFEIPLPPLQNLTSITTYALDDTATVLDPALYRVDAAAVPARVAWTETTVPPTNLRNLNALAIAFTCRLWRCGDRRARTHPPRHPDDRGRSLQPSRRRRAHPASRAGTAGPLQGDGVVTSPSSPATPREKNRPVRFADNESLTPCSEH